MPNKSILSEAKEIQLVTELIRLGARLQVLENNSNLMVHELAAQYTFITIYQYL